VSGLITALAVQYAWGGSAVAVGSGGDGGSGVGCGAVLSWKRKLAVCDGMAMCPGGMGLV
jgi:hypothetical protein